MEGDVLCRMRHDCCLQRSVGKEKRESEWVEMAGKGGIVSQKGKVKVIDKLRMSVIA